MVRIALFGLTLAVAWAGSVAPAGAQTVQGGGSVTIPSGEVHEGDLYAAGEAVRVDGRLSGDLVVGARRVVVEGQVDGDVFAAGNTIDLRGPIGDSTRIVGQMLTVDTTIDGDLLAAGSEVLVSEGRADYGRRRGYRQSRRDQRHGRPGCPGGGGRDRHPGHGARRRQPHRRPARPGARRARRRRPRLPGADAPEPRGGLPGGGSGALPGASGGAQPPRGLGCPAVALADPGGAGHRPPRGRAVPAARAASGHHHRRGDHCSGRCSDSPPS